MDDESSVKLLQARRDEIAADPKKYIQHLQDNAMYFLKKIDERIARAPNTSMWEHLQYIIWLTEECADKIVEDELLRLDEAIKAWCE